jgi:hypothetical protein
MIAENEFESSVGSVICLAQLHRFDSEFHRWADVAVDTLQDHAEAVGLANKFLSLQMTLSLPPKQEGGEAGNGGAAATTNAATTTVMPISGCYALLRVAKRCVDRFEDARSHEGSGVNGRRSAAGGGDVGRRVVLALVDAALGHPDESKQQEGIDLLQTSALLNPPPPHLQHSHHTASSSSSSASASSSTSAPPSVASVADGGFDVVRLAGRLLLLLKTDHHRRRTDDGPRLAEDTKAAQDMFLALLWEVGEGGQCGSGVGEGEPRRSRTHTALASCEPGVVRTFTDIVGRCFRELIHTFTPKDLHLVLQLFDQGKLTCSRKGLRYE